jgi:hypothetical protein
MTAYRIDGARVSGSLQCGTSTRHSRRSRSKAPVDLLPQCPESGRSLRASPSVAMGHLRTHAPQQTASLFDHFVGEREQLVRYVEAERLSGFEVNNQLELAWLLHREIGGLGAFENSVDI